MLRTCCNFYNTLEVNDFTELEQHKLMKRSGLSPKLVIFQWRNLDRLLNADLRDILTVKGFSSLRTHAYRTPYCTEYHCHFFLAWPIFSCTRFTKQVTFKYLPQRKSCFISKRFLHFVNVHCILIMFAKPTLNLNVCVIRQ